VISYTPVGTGVPASSNVMVNVDPTNLDPGLDLVPVVTNATTSTESMTLVITAQAAVNSIDDVTSTVTGIGSCVNSVCGSFGGGVTSNVGGINIPYAESPSNPSGTETFSPVGGMQNTIPNPLSISTSMTLTDVITLTGGAAAGAIAHVSGLTLNVSQANGTTTPEPVTFFVIGAGLVVLATGTRRVRRRASGASQQQN
jgi:hypothetical protein